MPQIRSASVQAFIDRAHTKLITYFLDGNVRTQYGRHDFKSGRPAKDPYTVEMRRHDRNVAKNADRIKVALIYDMSTRNEVRRFRRGEWVNA